MNHLWHCQHRGARLFRNTIFCTVLSLGSGLVEDAWGGSERNPNKSLWEIGVVGGGGFVPDYPAAGDSHGNGVGTAYVLYRGDFLRIGEKGIVRGRLARQRNWELDVSLDGSFPADSDKNKARKGMPDLNWLGEIGPRLQITLARAARDAKIDLEIPVRAVVETNFTNFDFRGFVAAPRLAYQHKNFFRRGLEFKLSVGGNFATTELADYFYRVPEGFETAARSRYKANGGYMGSSLNFGLNRPLTRRIQLYVLGGVNSHHGAANENSPLFRDKTTFAVGAAVRWSLYQSDRRGYR
jgi:MipA family protein